MNVIYTVRIIANIRNLFYSAHIFIGNGGFIQLWNSQSELQTIIYDFTVNNQFTMFLCLFSGSRNTNNSYGIVRVQDNACFAGTILLYVFFGYQIVQVRRLRKVLIQSYLFGFKIRIE